MSISYSSLDWVLLHRRGCHLSQLSWKLPKFETHITHVRIFNETPNFYQHLTCFWQYIAPSGTDRRVDTQFVSFRIFSVGDKQQNGMLALIGVKNCVLL